MLRTIKKYFLLGMFLLIILIWAGSTFTGFLGDRTNSEPIDSIKCEVAKEIHPSEALDRSMFKVIATSISGISSQTKDFQIDIEKAPDHGENFEVMITVGEINETILVPLTRSPVVQFNIGYPSQEDVKAVVYSNGDLSIQGKGKTLKFSNGDTPWKNEEFSHVYFDSELETDNMDYWFTGNEKLLFINTIPSSVESLKGTFSGCKALEQTPDFFQCDNLRIMEDTFKDCISLKATDDIPISVVNMKETYSGCTMLINPPDLSKTNNLMYISGSFENCSNLVEVPNLPDSIIEMNSAFSNCTNVREIKRFPAFVEDIDNAFENCISLEKSAAIPKTVECASNCFSGCENLYGNLEINTNTDDCDGFLRGAVMSGRKLTLSGDSSKLIEIQQEADNRSIQLESQPLESPFVG